MLIEQELRFPVDPGERLQFEEILGRFDSDECFEIMTAYDLAEEIHNTQKRSSSIKYFSHPRKVALTLTALGIDDPDIISAALLHDVIEDAKLINGEGFVNNSEWMDRADAWLAENKINPRVRQMVSYLTKPKIDNVSIFTNRQRRNQAAANLREAVLICPGAVLVKMADRLHNLQTLGALDDWKAEMVIQETQNVYFSIFSELLEIYPVEQKGLLKQLGEAICDYEFANSY